MIEAERGYLIIAKQHPTIDYIQCARVLAKSIRVHTPNANICLLTDSADYRDSVFSKIAPFPIDVATTTNPFQVESLCFMASPYRQTIKLEADMIVPRSIEHWWDYLQHRDVVVSSGALTFQNQPATARTYRQVFDDNDLPDVYGAITYWRVCQQSLQFFDLMAKIWASFDDIRGILKYAGSETGSSDLVYAIAAKIIGVEKTTLPGPFPKIVHMKTAINGLDGDDWRESLTWELTPNTYRVGTVAQTQPFHYHIKEHAAELEPIYDRILENAKRI